MALTQGSPRLSGCASGQSRTKQASRVGGALSPSSSRELYASEMNVAFRAWQDCRVVRARALREKQRPLPGQTICVASNGAISGSIRARGLQVLLVFVPALIDALVQFRELNHARAFEVLSGVPLRPGCRRRQLRHRAFRVWRRQAGSQCIRQSIRLLVAAEETRMTGQRGVAGL